jgi:hypothetical protein
MIDLKTVTILSKLSPQSGIGEVMLTIPRFLVTGAASRFFRPSNHSGFNEGQHILVHVHRLLLRSRCHSRTKLSRHRRARGRDRTA